MKKLFLFLTMVLCLPVLVTGASRYINTIDATYDGKTSTTTVGRLTATSTVNIGYAVKEVSILTKGLESSTTSNYWAGTLYIPDGVSSTILFDVPISTNFTITSTLGASTTVYYTIRGAK